MGRLRVGRGTLFDAIIPDHRSLHEFDKLLDWKRIETYLEVVYTSKEGGFIIPSHHDVSGHVAASVA